MSILYRKDLVKLDGSGPMLLYGYGSYEVCFVFSYWKQIYIYAIMNASKNFIDWHAMSIVKCQCFFGC
jgi:hypothetical protein